MNNYIGRGQQKKGTIIRKSQIILFGEELPRGHGYKGKLSTKLSHLYDEITGRTPRKRQAKLVTSTAIPSTKRIDKEETSIRPCIGIVGDNRTAILVAKRLLLKKYTVVVMASDIFTLIRDDQELMSKLQIEEKNEFVGLQLIPLLPRFLQVVQVIFVMVGGIIMLSMFICLLLPLQLVFYYISNIHIQILLSSIRHPLNHHLFLSTPDQVVFLLKQIHPML